MALTPDDAVHKEFQRVRFKDGFDPDEVDDFIDEIVLEWRKALDENADLKAKLASAEASLAEAQSAAPSATPAPAAAPAPAPAAAEATGGSTQTAGIIELAQRLHDEHVAEGEAKRQQLISEAEAEVARIRSEAETAQRNENARLDRERVALEHRINELQEFEQNYRKSLRAALEEQLATLDNSETGSGQAPISSIGR